MSEIIETVTQSVPKQNEIDYGKALTWYLKDKNFWPTVLTLSLYIFSCIFILPILYVGPFLTGYIIKSIRSIQQGNYEVQDLSGNCWSEGVTLLLIAVAISLVLGIMFFVIIFGASILSAVLSKTSTAGGAVLGLLTQLLSVVLQMVTSLVFPIIYFMAYAIYAKTGSTSSLFSIENYREVWRQNTWGILISYVVSTAAISVLTTAGFIACCLGIFPAAVASNYIVAGFVGQFRVENVE